MAETWGKVTAEVEFEENPRTVGPFQEVIREYQRHLSKALRRGKNTAAREYEGTIERLEAINGI